MDVTAIILCLVVAVLDGDSLVCKTPEQQKIQVRLVGIDAPEYKQAYSKRAREALSRITLNRQARLECVKTDQYKRRVCKVFVQPESCPRCGKTLDAGLALLTQGMAWWYRHYANEQPPEDRGAYEFAEREARAKRVGLWRHRNPVPPWEWRRRNRR